MNSDEQLRRLVEAGKTAHPDSAWIPSMASELLTLREALQSIAKNTCCDRCQEAALVAKAALAAPK